MAAVVMRCDVLGGEVRTRFWCRGQGLVGKMAVGQGQVVGVRGVDVTIRKPMRETKSSLELEALSTTTVQQHGTLTQNYCAITRRN